jgi:hypothetical protein
MTKQILLDLLVLFAVGGGTAWLLAVWMTQ